MLVEKLGSVPSFVRLGWSRFSMVLLFSSWFSQVVDVTWLLCEAFGNFHNASTSIYLGTLRHQPDFGGSTYIHTTTSSVAL